MGCACKRVNSFDKKYGVKMEESLTSKIGRNLLKVGVYTIAVGLVIIAVPIVIGITLYKMFLGKETKITLPKFMIKYLQ